jgi:hypothetical protein
MAECLEELNACNFYVFYVRPTKCVGRGMVEELRKAKSLGIHCIILIPSQVKSQKQTKHMDMIIRYDSFDGMICDLRSYLTKYTLSKQLKCLESVQ